MSLFNIVQYYQHKGGTGSGDFGHTGRPGKVGGSGGGKGGSVTKRENIKNWLTSSDVEGGLTTLQQIDAKGNYHNADEKTIGIITNWLMRHDENVLKGIGSITVAKSSKAFGVAWREESGERSHAPQAFFIPKFRSIYVRSGISKNAQSVFDHEVAHAAKRLSTKKGTWNKAYRDDKTFDRHTQYSKTLSEEGFAESYMSYIATGGQAKSSKVTKTYKVVEQVLNGIKK